ncbi:hypothetical protein GCM10009841_10910 [Microlunatus panaciterrae]
MASVALRRIVQIELMHPSCRLRPVRTIRDHPQLAPSPGQVPNRLLLRAATTGARLPGEPPAAPVAESGLTG